MEIHEPECKCLVESIPMRMKRRGKRSYLFVAVCYRLPSQTGQNTKLK